MAIDLYPEPGVYAKGIADAAARVRAGGHLTDDELRHVLAMSGHEHLSEVYVAIPEMIGLFTELVLQMRREASE